MSANRHTVQRYSELIGILDDTRTGNAERSVALVLGKIDNIDGLNARYGYATGDKLLDAFFEKLQGVARAKDVMLEISSSSFAFVIDSPLHEGHVRLAAEKIYRLAEEWIKVNDARIRLGVSMGCTYTDNARDSSELLLKNAETALQDCRTGDQHVMFFDQHEDEAVDTASHPMFDAHKAIENGEFRLHYQPQFELESGELVGTEALVRWSGPDGLLSPASFMNELERARALIPLLRFVMNNASREMARWVRRLPELQVSINSSATDLEDADLVAVMREVLGMWNLNPAQLKLEITETSLMRDPALGIETLHQIRELGVKTSIDDFGTGYSSLSWLKSLPVDELKIDKSFVQRIIDDKRDRKIVESIIDLAHAMNLTVVAEGIESEDVVKMLVDAGCDVGQGYFLSEPLTGPEFERCWLSRAGIARHSSNMSEAGVADI